MLAVMSDFHYPSDKERQKHVADSIEMLRRLSADNNDLIKGLFICGDFTDNRNDALDQPMRLPDYIKGLPWPVFFIDGNHEDYEVLKRLEGIDLENLSGAGAKRAADGIFYLQRGSCCVADGMRILAIGGSTSGPGYKKRHIDIWQPEEDISEKERRQIYNTLEENNYNFDIVLTHTLPETRMKQWYEQKDRSVTNEIIENVFKEIEYRQWFFGHFHCDEDFPGDFHCLYRDVALIERHENGYISCRRLHA